MGAKTLDGLRVCATDFDAYMKVNLLMPFGMASSGYLYGEGMARPHDEKGRLIADRESTAVDAARYGLAGNLHSTTNDHAKFLIEIIDPKPPAQAHAFEGIGYVGSRLLAFRDGDGRSIDMSASTVSVNTFGLLRVPPMLGRFFAGG